MNRIAMPLGVAALTLTLTLALALAGGARAQEAPAQQVKVGPPPAWVRPAAAIKTDSPDDGASVRLLLLDGQAHVGPEGVTRYSESAIRVQTPQGLQAMSTLSLNWDPALGELTVHKLVILRGGQTIDVLAGQKFTVLRREKNLEAQQLNGMLSAVIQPEDLRVGDVVDLAYSETVKDPALGGHVQWANVAPNTTIDDLRLTVTSDQPISWRATDGFDGLQPGVTSQGRQVTVAMTNVQPMIPPNGAPARFRRGRVIQVSDFKSWAEVSAVMAPLFAKASTLKADSPLQAEIARIKAASTDPKARAEAALALVQDQVRYIALTMNDGGYVPADADLTWKRRFGDCKAKTVLLLALLHGLGVEAQPALVNLNGGDGLDERLPAVDAFDHVIVRATLGGRVYWLDGTRLGDKRLDDILTPNMHWALPVQAAGAALTPLVVAQPDKPMIAMEFRVDASKGIEVPPKVHAEAVFRGDAALALSTGLNNLTEAQRDATLREFWAKSAQALSPAQVSARYDPLAREERMTLDGTTTTPWQPGPNGGRGFFVEGAALGLKTDFNRAPGPHADAPFAVPYPQYGHVIETVILPNGGQGFRVQGGDVDLRIAGRSLARKVSLDKGVFTAETTTKSLAPEFPASEAAAATQAFQDLGRQQVYVIAPSSYRMTADDVTAYAKRPLTTAADLMRRGEAMRQRGLLAQARTDMEQAIAINPRSAPQYADIAQVYALQGDFAAAREALRKGEAINPGGPGLGRAAGFVAMLEGRYPEAVEAFGRMLAKDPTDRYSRRERAVAYGNLGQADKAADDAETLLQANPRDAEARQLKVLALIQGGKGEEALAAAEAGIALEPKSAAAHALKGDAFRILRRDADAQGEYDKALDAERTAQGYLARAGRRLPGDHAARIKDIEAALKLDPGNVQALSDRAREEALLGQADKAAADLAEVVAKNPDEAGPRRVRALAYARAGKAELAAADYDWLRAHAEETGAAWNAICSEEARWGLSPDKAVADCDKGVSLAPRNAAGLDSRALLLLRLGKLDDAIAAYDQTLKLAPRQAESLYGRGLAELLKGLGAPGQTDLTAARALRPHIDEVFAEYGFKPPAANAAAGGG
jgi:tetratricopeptide (TPR) repeat protein